MEHDDLHMMDDDELRVEARRYGISAMGSRLPLIVRIKKARKAAAREIAERQKFAAEEAANWHMNAIHFRDCRDCDDTVRVWKHNWPGDRFEVLSGDEWEVLQKYLKRFSIRVQEHDDITDNEEFERKYGKLG